MIKKMATLTAASLLIGSLTFSTAFAFSDVEAGQATAVNALKDRGVVSGVDRDHFMPRGTVTYAQSLQMIVKALDLNLDLLRFFKEPLATDIYTNIPNDAWFANSFVIAKYSGLDIPKDVNPNATMTREQFGHLLVQALEKKGNFPLVKMFISIQDEDQITSEYQGSLQRLLLYKIATLQADGKFNPKGELTRGEAAIWVYNASNVLDAHSDQPVAHSEEIKVTIDKINDDVNKVTLSRGEKSNAGYGIDISTIHFAANGQAVITYTLRNPQPDGVYADVITEAKTVTYLSSKYKPVAEQAVAQVPAPAPSPADTISEAMNKQIKELFELAKQGKVPGIAFAAHTNLIDDVLKAWGPADAQKSEGKGLIYDSFNDKNTVIGFNKGSQIFAIQSNLPTFKQLNIQQIEQVLGKPIDMQVGQDSSTYIYAANDQFQLHVVITNSTGFVDHVSVLSPKDAVNNMAQ